MKLYISYGDGEEYLIVARDRVDAVNIASDAKEGGMIAPCLDEYPSEQVMNPQEETAGDICSISPRGVLVYRVINRPADRLAKPDRRLK